MFKINKFLCYNEITNNYYFVYYYFIVIMIAIMFLLFFVYCEYNQVIILWFHSTIIMIICVHELNLFCVNE